MVEVLNHADQGKDSQLRADIYKYNARHGVDNELTKNLMKDLKAIHAQNVQIPTEAAQSYFDAVVESQDFDERERLVQATSLIKLAPAEDHRDIALRVKALFGDLLQ